MSRFLIIRFSSIGDIVLTTPVIRCLKTQVRDAEVHYLTKGAYREVVEHNPYIDKKIFFENNLEDTIKTLRGNNYDYIIDLHNNLRSSLITSRLKARSFAFNKVNLEKWIMVNLKFNFLPQVHIVERYMKTVKSQGVKNDGKGLDYFISESDELATAQLQASHQKYIAFAIGAQHETKKLPVKKIINICSKITAPVVLVGGKEDEKTGSEAAASGKNIINACGKFSINGSAALIKHARCVITHDTGMMHIAAAFKKNIISVWGNTIPEFGMTPYYGALPVEHKIFEIKNLSCRPCSKLGFGKCPLGHFKCMQLISEDEIAKQAENFFS